MLEELRNRIKGLDLKRPYVWRLRISEAEFKSLEAAVYGEKTTALENVVYLAEWYKRRYDGGVAKPIREFKAQELFEASGIEAYGNLFETENGKKTWLYSIYVLGGLAIPFELGKTDSRFLKELCKIYYGEDGDVDKLGIDDKSRAVAFRESVRTCGCLYEFIQAVLSDDKPFAADDLAQRGSQVNAFIARIKSANDEVLKSKFDLEWVIGFDPHMPYMTRKLRLRLKPESLGGRNHQYLKFERVRLWGVNPERCKHVSIGVRFLNDGAVVSEPDFTKPIVEYSTTGGARSGFVAWGVERVSKKIDVPVGAIDSVEIVARDDQGKDHFVEKFAVPRWMQVFRDPDSYTEWTSRHNAQRDSAVIIPADYELSGDKVGVAGEVFQKRFWQKDGSRSDLYKWCQVIDLVRFLTSEGEEVTVYNRQGYDQILAWPHCELLRYRDGLVNYYEDVDGECEESQLPLVFGRADIVVRHFETKNDLTDDWDPESTYDGLRIEFLDKGQYREWVDGCGPTQGKTTLRIWVRGAARKFVVYYLPMDIERDCRNGEIVCGDRTLKCAIDRNGVPTDPTVVMNFGTDNAFVGLELWQPTEHKELIRNGRVVRYVEKGERAEISFALKDGLTIHDFGEFGFHAYDCSGLSGVYRPGVFNPATNGQVAAAFEAKQVNAHETLDEMAPEWLDVNLATRADRLDQMRLLHWNYDPRRGPVVVSAEFACQGDDVVFQSLKGYEGVSVQCPRNGEDDPFEKTVEADLVRCFEVATEHGAYYFSFQPFREPYVDFARDVYVPLLAKRKGGLSSEDRRGLLRLAEEFGFNWLEKFGITV